MFGDLRQISLDRRARNRMRVYINELGHQDIAVLMASNSVLKPCRS